MGKQAKLILMRHGQSEWNRLNLFTGWVDIPLSLQGIQEAIEGGEENSPSADRCDLCLLADPRSNESNARDCNIHVGGIAALSCALAESFRYVDET